MDLKKLYELQKQLDYTIIENGNIRRASEMDPDELFEKTRLASLVELAELSNTTRCFKHWSTKGKMADEIIIEELADVWHFYLSLGNQIGCSAEYRSCGSIDVADIVRNINKVFRNLSFLHLDYEDFQNRFFYRNISSLLYAIAEYYNFTPEQVEKAYLTKHEENYKRQSEGY